MRNVSGKVVEKFRTYFFMFSNFFPPEIPTVYENVEKYITFRQAIDDNVAHALCVLCN